MTSAERKKLLKQIMWDYRISPEEVDAVLKGKAEKAGHYNREVIFIKLLESYSWFIILQLFSPLEIKKLLTDDVIKRLCFKSLQIKYGYVRKRLQQILF